MPSIPPRIPVMTRSGELFVLPEAAKPKIERIFAPQRVPEDVWKQIELATAFYSLLTGPGPPLAERFASDLGSLRKTIIRIRAKLTDSSIPNLPSIRGKSDFFRVKLGQKQFNEISDKYFGPAKVAASGSGI